MLKKCLKHEWKACWKNMALLNGAAIFMGALGGFGFLFSQISELPEAVSLSIPLRFLIFGVLQLVFMFWALRYLFLPLLLQQLYI